MVVFRFVGFYLIFTLVLVVGCSSGGGDGGDDEIVGTGVTVVTGAAQKGPFIIGSNVTVNLLTETGQATTNTIITSTSDDLGNFNFQLDEPSLLQIRVDGYHFNEISGTISNGPISLNATFDTNDSVFVIVNVLTHLINNRVLFLIEQGSLPSAAITQAQTEMITALNSVLLVTALPDFTQLSVYNLDGTNPIGNAYLLALSATLYNYADIEVGGDSGLLSGKLTETLNTLAADLETDGVLDNTVILTGLVDATRTLNPDDIETNLTNRSIDVLGVALSVPDINLFIDTDQDGTVNSIDDDDDGDGILDTVDAEPYVFNNIPTVESFSLSADGGAEVVYNEVVDSALASGYQTKLAAHIDETRTPGGVITPTPTIHLSHNEGDGKFRLLNIYLPAEAPGTYYIDDVTRVRYFLYSEDVVYFDYRPESGSITISEYGDIGNAVVGSYDVTLSCNSDFVDCSMGDLLRITGEFTLVRDEPQHFISVGAAANPVDLGGFPFSNLWSRHFTSYFFDGYNMNLVSPTSPSYYQLSVNPQNQYTVGIPNHIGGIRMTVYGTSAFDTPLCESFTDPIACTVTPMSDTLYFTVEMLNPTASGAWYNLTIEPASFVDEGTAINPVDITGPTPYSGQVGLVGSYYRFNVTPGTMHHFSFQGIYGSTDFEVATDNTFNNIVCEMYVSTRNYACNIAIDPPVTELFVRVFRNINSTLVRDGGFFSIDNWEITLPLYYIEISPTPVIDPSACARVTVYELDGTEVPGLHQHSRNFCSIDSFTGTIPLEPGRTYNVEIHDNLGSTPDRVDYYVVWIGASLSPGTFSSITPDVELNEPSNNTVGGAMPLAFETLHYDSFTSTDSDVDWFTITIPDI